MVRQGAITYDGLPISSGGAHSLRQKGFVAAFLTLQNFVNGISLERTPRNVSLELFENSTGNYSHFLALSSEFDDKFEQKEGRHIGEHKGNQWSVESAQLEPLIYDLESLRPIPVVGYAGRSLVVHVYWDLVFSDSSGHQLPFQARNYYMNFDIDFQRYLGESFVYSRISENSTASIFLSLPFEEVSSECVELAKRIQEAFPARLSTKHWKQWSLTKRRTSYLGRKMLAAPL